MDGVRVVAVDDASILVLEEVTQEVKDALKANIVDYCYGRVNAAEDSDYYSLETTIKEFFRLYDAKSDTTRLGIAGELIVHLLLPHGHERLVSAALYLNKEESAIKKGFDLTFYDEVDDGLWYGEVKAGRVNPAESADSKVRDLVGLAERGLHKMFTTDIRKKRWDAAQLDADATLNSKQANTVKNLLRADFKTIRLGNAAEVRALLCGVVMHQLDLGEIDATTGQVLIDSITERGRFAGLRILLIQQTDLEDLIEVLRSFEKATTQ